MWNQIKTIILLGALSGLLLFLGMYIGGRDGLTTALILALAMNLIAYFFSDKIVLTMYRAQRLDEQQYPQIYNIVKDLSAKMDIPMPKLWLVPVAMANAFATGRNPKNASIGVTSGILEILNERELRGVLAHELAHIKNRDILITTIAAVLATAISYVANMMYYTSIYGLRGTTQRRDQAGPLAAILIVFLTPIAASLIQLAISRAREFFADEKGAHVSEDPAALASALIKLHTHTAAAHLQGSPAQASTAPLFIVQPFINRGWLTLFATHPPVQARVARLEKMMK